MNEVVKNLTKDELENKLKALTEREEKLKNLLIIGKQKEEEIAKQLEAVKAIIQKKMGENKKKTKEGIRGILSTAKEKTGIITKGIASKIQKNIESIQEKRKKEKKRKQKIRIQKKKEKLINLIEASNNIFNQGLMDSKFSQGGKLIKLNSDARALLEGAYINEKEIDKNINILFKETQRIAKQLKLGKISKSGKLVRKEQTKHIKETPTKQADSMEEIKKLSEQAENLGKILKKVQNDNKKMEANLKDIQEQKKSLEGENVA